MAGKQAFEHQDWTGYYEQTLLLKDVKLKTDLKFKIIMKAELGELMFQNYTYLLIAFPLIYTAWSAMTPARMPGKW